MSEAFESWWYNEGSGMPPLPGEDAEMHTRRVSEIAWRTAIILAADCIVEDGNPMSARARIMRMAKEQKAK